MKNQNNLPDQPFVIKPSVASILSFGIGVFAVFFFIGNISGSTNIGLSLVLAVVGLFCLVILIHRKPTLIVDYKGIVVEGARITDWAHFNDAGFSESESSEGCELWIEYSKPHIEGFFKSTVTLPSTSTATEEGAIAAITFFKNKFNSSSISSGA